MGIRGSGLHPGAHRHRNHARRRAPGRALHPAVPQRHRQASGLHPRLPLPGRRRLPPSTRAWRTTSRATARRSSRTCASTIRRCISFGGFGEVLPRKENRVTLDADVKDAWGIPVLRFDYHLRRQRAEDGQGHGRHRRGDAAARRAPRTSRSSASRCRRAGRSTRSAPRAWATIRRRRSPIASAACTTCPTCTSPTPRRSSAAARRTRRGRSSRWRGGRWICLKDRASSGALATCDGSPRRFSRSVRSMCRSRDQITIRIPTLTRLDETRTWTDANFARRRRRADAPCSQPPTACVPTKPSSSRCCRRISPTRSASRSARDAGFDAIEMQTIARADEAARNPRRGQRARTCGSTP